MSLFIQNLYKQYDDKVAVNSISFELPKGQVLGLLGRNGAGKTTTIKMILGLLPPDNGQILWDGKPINRNQLSIGYLPEERGLYPKTKIKDQLRYFGKLEGMSNNEIDSKIDFWLERFQITEYKNKLAGELSKGNQQKIQLIVTLLHDPELVILDEPFSGLDPVNANMLREVIEELIKQKKTVILSSHQMEQIELFCENILILKNGNPLISGELNRIKKEYGYKNLVVTSETDLDSFFKENNLEYEKRGLTYKTKIKDDKETLRVLNSLTEKGIEMNNFSMLEPTLHQIFVERAG